MKRRLTPTPGIEKMHPKIARAHFQARWEEILRNAGTLPPAEQFRLVADLLDAGLLGQARGIAQQALAAISPEARK